jgi:hypothetical protein
MDDADSDDGASAGGILCIVTVIWKLPRAGPDHPGWHGRRQVHGGRLVNGQWTPSPWGFSISQKTVVMLMLFGLTNGCGSTRAARP